MYHGKASTYNHGCRCERCRQAHSNYKSDYLRRKRTGTDDQLVSAALVREVLLNMRRRGVTYQCIHRITGISHVSINRIVHCRQRRVHTKMEREILQVEAMRLHLGATPRKDFLPGDELEYMLTELQQMGYSRAELRRMLRATGPDMDLRPRPWIMRRTYNRFLPLYRRLTESCEVR